MTTVAVVQFPGSNCETETCDVLRVAGAHPEIVRWNAPSEVWDRFDAYVLPGGFAYEDRVRAGAIAAKHAALDRIAQAADTGRPVLGICNGAQVLVEAGLVPGVEPGHVEVALAANAAPEWRGYYCEWVHIAPATTRGIAGALEPGPVPMPIGHGEGRFTARPEVFEDLERRGQVAFRYVRPDGSPAHGFPHNPNGALQDVAGLCDPTGLVVALMPHPERGAWLYQVPEELPGAWGDLRRRAGEAGTALVGPGPGLVVYRELVRTAHREG